MKTAFVVLGCLFWTFAVWNLPSFGSDQGSGRQPVLANVTGLDKRITYTEVKVPLGELVQKVAADTGVKLTAAQSVAEEPVAVVVSDLPASQFLEELAELLDYRWSRWGKQGAWRYEIDQDLASKEREEALRQSALADVERRLREQLAPLIEVAALPEEQYRALRRAAEGEGPRAGKVTEERSRLLKASSSLSSPVSRAMAGLVGQLSAQQWSVLRNGRVLNFFTDPQPGELALPAVVAHTFREFRPSMDETMRGIVGAEGAVGNDALGEAVKQDDDQWIAATRYRVVIRLRSHSRQYRTGGSLLLEVRALPILREAHQATPYFHGDAGCELMVSAGPVDWKDSETELTAERRVLLERDPVLGATKIFRAKTRTRPRPYWPAGTALWRLPELLPELAQTYGVQFLADAYWNAPSIPMGRFSTTAPTALFSLLDRLAGRHYRWDRREKLVRLRSRTWFFDRPREIPLRVVLGWKELCTRHGALPLEEYAGSVVRLTEDQLQSLGDLSEEASFPPELHDLIEAEFARHALRLYALLDPGHRERLRQGEAIPLVGMTPAQRQLFLAQWEETSASRTTLPTPADLAVASFSLGGRHLTRVIDQRGETADDRLEPVETPPGVAGAPPGTESVSKRTRATPREAHIAGRRPSPPASGAPRVVRYPVTRLEFRFDCGPHQRELVWLTVASPR
jgi:hypothetical protein